MADVIVLERCLCCFREPAPGHILIEFRERRRDGVTPLFLCGECLVSGIECSLANKNSYPKTERLIMEVISKSNGEQNAKGVS